MFHLFKTKLESGILVSGMSMVWEDTDGCSKQYRCVLDVYLTNVLSSSFGIIMDHTIIEPGHVKNVVDGLNTRDKSYLKEKWKLLVN